MIISIIGMGPRGCSLLERIITYTINHNLQNKIKIILFEKSVEFGSGSHPTHTPEHLLLNTIAGQMTMFWGDEMSKFGPIHDGPTFFDWYYNNKTKMVKPTDYLSRKSLGEYLSYFYKEQIKRLIKNEISFLEVSDEVIDIVESNDITDIITTSELYKSNTIAICTGHQKSPSPNIGFNESFINDIPAQHNVVIKGMGLTSFDIISQLTEGRGGNFVSENNKPLKYIASGKEPKLYLYSRTGLFLSSRSHNAHPDFVYQAKFFTIAAIDKLRSNKELLDFEEDVLPLLIKELKCAYYSRSNGQQLDVRSFFAQEKRLDISSRQTFIDSFNDYLSWDVKESLIGKFNSPYKFCQDTIRDLRDTIRYAVDFKGLTEESHQTFINKWQPRMNRICVGPPYISLMQLQALIKAGICSVDYAYNPSIEKQGDKYKMTCSYINESIEIIFDTHIEAQTPSLDYNKSQDFFIQSLTKKYKIFNNGDFIYGGLEIDKKHNIKSKNNKSNINIYALGLACEGSKYFTLVLGRPNIISTFLFDSNLVANDIIEKLKNSLRNKNQKTNTV